MFPQESPKNLTDLIMRCCSSMVEFRKDAEEVQETFPLTAMLTAMGECFVRLILCRYVATGRVWVIAFIQELTTESWQLARNKKQCCEPQLHVVVLKHPELT